MLDMNFIASYLEFATFVKTHCDFGGLETNRTLAAFKYFPRSFSDRLCHFLHSARRCSQMTHSIREAVKNYLADFFRSGGLGFPPFR